MAIHAGNEPILPSGAVSVPIYQTFYLCSDGLGQHKALNRRTQNTTRLALEKNIAALENARFGFAFASGMSATEAVLKLVKAWRSRYSGRQQLTAYVSAVRKILSNYGIEFDLADTSDVSKVEAAFRPNTKMLFIETPTNPVMTVCDIKAVSDVAHAHGAKVVCDNTFMSPYFQQPLVLGADIVVHSTTKYINGHSDSIGGFVALNDEQDAEWIKFVQNGIGAILSPFDSFLVLRGTKTLAVRMQAHDKNGRVVANFLAEHPAVQKVYYPGLVSTRSTNLQSGSRSGFGAWYRLDWSLDNAKKVLEGVKLCTLVESLGGRIIDLSPASMTHASSCRKTRQRH